MDTNIINLYKKKIHDKYNDFIQSGVTIDNYKLAKIFEWFSCIKLSQGNDETYLVYEDIPNDFKEKNKMTRKDSGIDACNMVDAIVQCKLRDNSLTWKECATFFGSQTMFDSEKQQTVVRWQNMIITRNAESSLSSNLKSKSEMFIDFTFNTDDIIKYCNRLIKKPPELEYIEPEFTLRDYQKEAIELIVKKKQNTIISIPTGCGKNSVIIFSLKPDRKYLILVPRIILMDQFKDELIKRRPEFKKLIHTIGDGSNEYNPDKNITICVYNSVNVVQPYAESFYKIFIDEAHHINIPEIYTIDNDDYNEYDTEDEIDDYESDDENNSEDEIESDDTEDEIKNSTSFNKIIKSFKEHGNNVYLSATIDETEGFLDYRKDIRDMIEQGHLCDYTIKIPIFSDDPSNKNICEYLINNYRSIIIYCNSQKEGKQFNNLMNSLVKGCSEYIDCNTTKKWAKWISQQICDYPKKINIMRNENIRNHWEQFITEYQ
jgi:hypothetical protein